jgi:hypothetical protein
MGYFWVSGSKVEAISDALCEACPSGGRSALFVLLESAYNPSRIVLASHAELPAPKTEVRTSVGLMPG